MEDKEPISNLLEDQESEDQSEVEFKQEDQESEEQDPLSEETLSEEEPEEEEKKRRTRKSKNREASMTLIAGNRYKNAEGCVYRKYIRTTPSGGTCTQFVKETRGTKKYDAFNHIFKSDITNLIKQIKPDKKTLAKIRLSVLKILEELIIEQENN